MCSTAAIRQPYKSSIKRIFSQTKLGNVRLNQQVSLNRILSENIKGLKKEHADLISEQTKLKRGVISNPILRDNVQSVASLRLKNNSLKTFMIPLLTCSFVRTYNRKSGDQTCPFQTALKPCFMA